MLLYTRTHCSMFACSTDAAYYEFNGRKHELTTCQQCNFCVKLFRFDVNEVGQRCFLSRQKCVSVQPVSFAKISSDRCNSRCNKHSTICLKNRIKPIVGCHVFDICLQWDLIRTIFVHITVIKIQTRIEYIYEITAFRCNNHVPYGIYLTRSLILLLFATRTTGQRAARFKRH